MMKESRLFTILYYLLENGKTKASELAERCQVSSRTIYRDIDVLSSSGIPVYASQGKDGGIEILPDFVLQKALLSASEREQLITWLQGLRGIAPSQIDDLLQKLSALFQPQHDQWLEVDYSTWSNSSTFEQVFVSLKSAILEKRVLSFDYFAIKSKQKLAKRSVKPIRLVFKAQSWYLYAYCLTRNDFRFFKLNRLKNLIITQETFTENYGDVEMDKQLMAGATCHLRLKFSKVVAARVYDDFQELVAEDDNFLWVEADLPDLYVYDYVLSFGEYVEVLEPEHVRLELARKIKILINKYKT